MAKFKQAGLVIASILSLSLVGGRADAGGITVTNNGNAADLVKALLAGGTGGITVTGYSLSNQSTPDTDGAMSTGIYTTSGPNNYKLPGSGIVLSTGDASRDGSASSVIHGLTKEYKTNATPTQVALLQPLSPGSAGFHDVTQLTISFDVDANTTSVHFGVVFASAEYPKYANPAENFNDAFGLFLNGTNIAFAGGKPVNINNPMMVDTDSAAGAAYQETALQGLLVGPGGNPFMNFGGAVVAGSKGNTLTFIIADANDSRWDTAVYISGLGNAPPPGTVPEPASLALLGLGVSALALYSRRRASK
jgi:PEP-CTERM motif